MHAQRQTIGILDDHPIILSGLSAFLADYHDFNVVGTYSRSEALFDALQCTPIDIAVIDYFLEASDRDCADILRELHTTRPSMRILVVSATQDPALVALAMRCGAHGFLSKDEQESNFIQALRQIQAGKRYLTPGLAHLLPEQLNPPEASQDNDADAIDPRIANLLRSARLSSSESLVLRLLIQGANVVQIAAQLGRSPKTISTHKAAAFRKLGVSTDCGLFKLIFSTTA